MNLTAVNLTPSEIEDYCRNRYIRKLALFGSIVRDDFGPESDVDVLVEFLPGHIPGYNFFSIESELSQIFGRKVDLQTSNFLSPEIRRVALAEALVIYEQA
jgi:uncharacterized protein